MATLHRLGALPFSDLHARLRASRDTLSETLGDLVASGLVERDNGRRSAYRLTSDGIALGDPCLAAVAAVRESGTLTIALKKWPMFVLVATGRRATRFGDLMEALPGVTPRALAMALKDLEREGLIERHVAETYPPSVAYRLGPGGAALFQVMDELVSACETMTATLLTRAAEAPGLDEATTAG